jgi:hypothetical protein
MRPLLVAVVLLAACDAPWAGPSLPSGAQWISYNDVGLGTYAGFEPAIRAATSLAALQAGDSLPEQPGRLYVAVVPPATCTQPVKGGGFALAGRDLYYVYWVGSPASHAGCAAARARPRYEVLAVRTSDLPRSGALTVRLEVQDEQLGTYQPAATTVALAS